MKFVVYDVEIAKLIPDRGGRRLPGYRYAESWQDYKGMGVACLAYYSSATGGIEAIRNPDFFRAVVDAHDLVIGFNSKYFDDPLMVANGVKVQTGYDILDEVRFAGYGSTDRQKCPKGYSYSLDAIGSANGFQKTEKGALAPKLWQDGERSRVIDYCINDVRMTLKILELGLTGRLVDPNNGNLLQLRPLPAVKTQLSLL